MDERPIARGENRATLDAGTLAREIVGRDFRFRTPFGERLLVYGDYTASGRNVRFIERYLMRIQESYANTHTEDDETGRSTTEMLHEAERTIKRLVNGNDDTRIIATGAGTTGAIQKLQEILGVYIPPATRRWYDSAIDEHALSSGMDPERPRSFLNGRRPVVFVGPYEHHSNEISWRESIADVIEIRLDRSGGIDLADLEKTVGDPRYAGRRKIGSFSAASNVTGIRTPVYDVARILHRHGALACFDFAACAPYVEIDMNRDEDAFFDALFFSPHKFLGGPGSSGILLFHRRIYPVDLPPTFAGGGTVDFVGPAGQDYMKEIEAREKAGTPGTFQILRAALAMELKEAVGTAWIEKREDAFLERFIERFGDHPGVEILGDPAPGKYIAIVSFNIRHADRYLHPKLVTRLLNDLFGIQSRAGCSCAGPYGHHLLDIGADLSTRYRRQVRAGHQGIKPGWVRVGFHYTMDDRDFEYVCGAIEFIASFGHLFLPLYRFSLATGTWTHVGESAKGEPPFDLAEARKETTRAAALDPEERREAYDRYLAEAREIAARLAPEEGGYVSLPENLRDLGNFYVRHVE